jgi:hydroxymethylbilane synthase
MFVKEIEQALLDGAVDVGVHSLKDMPAEMPGGLIIGCVPQREDPRDALVSASGKPLNELPNGAVIGTSSLRRQAQLRAFNPTFRVEELRGNLDTRLRRLDEGRYDAIVIACAGLIRLGFGARITEALSPVTCVPAVGQGAIAVQTRAEDSITLALVAALDHRDTADAVAAERGFLIALEGGCTLPAGALAEVEGELLRIAGVIVSPDGVHAVRDSVSGPRTQAASLGSTLANILIERGGRALLEG